MNNLIINSKNLNHNIKIIKKLAKTAKVCAVVKGEAYGHGMIEIANLIADKVDYFAVSTVKEAIELRKSNLKNNILVLGYILPNNVLEAIDFNLEITIGSQNQLKALIKHLKAKNNKIKIHIKKDSGLNRYGYKTKEELNNILDYLKRHKKYFEVVGFYTHFVITDENCEENILAQSIAYENDYKLVREAGFSPITHAASSTTLFLTKKYQYDMVRVGMALHGYCGYEEDLRKVMSIESHITDIKVVKKGDSIGYGEKNTISKDMVRALVPIGYGYGIDSILSNKSYVLIKGKACSIIGEMSMDCMYVDITNIPNLKIGEKVIFIGQDNKEELTATDHARALGVYSCEIMSHINRSRFTIKIK